MGTEQELISWKTDAWKDRNMVAGYAERMVDSSGAIMMKNRIEIAAFARNVRGKRVLDIGVGTGRASLPMARAGYDVTGVDSSVAMLQKCKELAGATPIELFEGDVARLQFGDAMFDTVMGLNTIGHFPHWQPILKEWQRVLKPGGRMIFDMFSLDHDIAYAHATGRDQAYGIEHFAPKDASGFYLRLKVEDLVAYANGAGLRIAGIQPYSVLIGSSGFNRFFDGTPLAGKSWDRLLTWVGADQKLFDFLTFVEEEFFGKLTTNVACRYIVALDHVADETANAQWLAKNTALNGELARGLSKDTLRMAGIDGADFRAKLNAHLAHPPNRYAFYRMQLANLGWKWPLDLADLLDEPYASEASAVIGRGALDKELTDLILHFHEAAGLKERFTYHGVPLASGWEYELMIELLDGPVSAFATTLDKPIEKAGSK